MSHRRRNMSMVQLALQSSPVGLNQNVHFSNDLPSGREDIYAHLAEHQRTEPWWLREVVTVLQMSAETFNARFNLGIPELVIGVDRLPRQRGGAFLRGHS